MRTAPLTSRPGPSFATRAAWTVAIGLVLAGLVGCGATPKKREELHEQAEFHYQLALGHWRAQEAPVAIQELNKTLELEPDHKLALYLLGFIYQGRFNYAETERLYRRALAVDPDWHEVSNNLGTVYLAQERWDEAEEIFRRLADTATYATPGHAYNNLGWAVFQQGRASEALEYFLLATRFQPALCLAYNNQGIAYERLGNARSAVEAYNEAVTRCAEYQEPLFRLAMLLLSLNRDIDRAEDLLEKCIEIGRESTFGRRCYEYVNPDTW